MITETYVPSAYRIGDIDTSTSNVEHVRSATMLETLSRTEATASRHEVVDVTTSNSVLLLSFTGTVVSPAAIIGTLMGIGISLAGVTEPAAATISTDLVRLNRDEPASIDTKPASQPNVRERSRSEMADSVRLLRENSGLTWDELARLLGVTRRALHNWANGAKISSQNAQNVARLTAILARADHGSAERTRAYLLAPTKEGKTLFEAIGQEIRGTRSVTGPAWKPESLLSVLPDLPDPTGTVAEAAELD